MASSIKSKPRKPSPTSRLLPLIDAKKIAQRMPGLAREIERDIKLRERPIAIVVLQGGFIFAADLLRSFSPRFEIDVAFVRCESYGTQTQSSGRVMLLQDIDPAIDLHGRTVLLIDDILDTGLTLKFLTEHLHRRGAARVHTCVLLCRSGRPAVPNTLCGFEIGSEFVVGYGLDYAGKYRHLPGLCVLDQSPPKRKRAVSR